MSTVPEIVTGKWLMERLADQWGGAIPVSLEMGVNDTCKKTQFIKMKCLGCGNTRRIAAQEILNLYQDGKVCNCGHPSNMVNESFEPESEIDPVDPNSVESIFNGDATKASVEDDQTEEDLIPTPTADESTYPEETEEPKPNEETVDETPPYSAEAEKETSDEPASMSDEDFSEALSDAFTKIENIIGYDPYDIENVLEDENDGSIDIKCVNCGSVINFESRLAVFEPRKGIDSPVSLEGMCNGKFGEDEYHHNCPTCIKTLADNNGVNVYLLNGIQDLCWDKHIKQVITNKTKLVSVKSEIEFEGDNGKRFIASIEDLDVLDSNKYAAPAKEPKPEKVRPAAIDPAVEEGLNKLSDLATQTPPPPRAEVLPKSNSIVDESTALYEKDSNEFIERATNEEEKKYESSKVFGHVVTDAPFCPYEDPSSALEDFYQSSFGTVIGSVSDKTGIPFTVRCDTSTLDIPVVDFPGGLRVVCIDLNESGQLNIPESFDNYVQHAYERDKSNMTKLFLYSDSVKFRYKAVEKALTKRLLVSNNMFDPARVITLGSDDKTIVYTTDGNSINEFERTYGLNAYGKPAQGRLAIIDVLQGQTNTQDLTKLLLNSRPSMDDLNMYRVASIRWLTEVAKDGSVKYTITDYIEHGLSVIKDGLFMCLIALSKEHDIKYPGMPYSFDVEYDRSSFMSPSIQAWLEEGGLLKNPYIQYEASYCWIKSPDNDVRVVPQDEQRQDRRLFGVMTMVNRFGKALRENGVNVKDERQRKRFIKDMGFTRCEQPPMIKLMVNPMDVFAMEYNMKKFTMMKIDPAAMMAIGGVTESGDDPNSEFQQMMLMKTIMEVSNQQPAAQQSSAPIAETEAAQNASTDDDFNDLLMMMAFMNMN